MRDTVLIEEMTWVEVKEAVASGKRRVIVMLGAMEQHGPHMAIGTDTYLGYAIGERLARRLGDALVAPVVSLGYSVGHLPMAGTVSIEESTLELVILDVCRSLARHGFGEIILLCSHGGNYRALRNVLARLRAEHAPLRISAITDFDEWLEQTRRFAAAEGLDMTRLGVHAGQGETSLMLAHRPDLVDMTKACEGFTGDASIRWKSKVPPPMETMSPTGILGDARGATAELGERMLTLRVERLAEMIRTGVLSGPQPPEEAS
jgi:creatinine amidohydrolase